MTSRIWTNASSELQKRVITGTIGAALFMLIVIFGGLIGITFLTAILATAMVNEFATLTLQLPDKTEKRYGLLKLAWFACLINGFSPRSEFEVLLVCFFLLTGAFLYMAKRHPAEDFGAHLRELMASLFGLFYIVFLFSHLPKVHQSANGVHWSILFFLIIWAGDTGAYFGGRRYGKRKLYPEISPKKTVEGSVAGLLSGLGVAVIYKLLLFRGANWGAILIIPLLVGAVAQTGDLVESFIKRAFGVKDSGTLLPGHGGFLDRFDSVIFGLPVMYACLRMFG